MSRPVLALKPPCAREHRNDRVSSCRTPSASPLPGFARAAANKSF